MSYSLNRVQLIGHLGQDPKANTSGSLSISNISLATNSTRVNRDTNERITSTEWHRISLFNQSADFANRYLKKGDYVMVEGTLRTRKYKDKDGIERYVTEIMASSINSLGRKNDSDDTKPQSFDDLDEDLPF